MQYVRAHAIFTYTMSISYAVADGTHTYTPGLRNTCFYSAQFCRKQLGLNFAVMLMRSTYEAVDALDFIAMDQFQVCSSHTSLPRSNQTIPPKYSLPANLHLAPHAHAASVQIRFFKLRQSEFEPYKFLVDPLQVPIGNLSSPLYFDFIAFSQYATLSKAIPDAPQVFQVRSHSLPCPQRPRTWTPPQQWQPGSDTDTILAN